MWDQRSPNQRQQDERDGRERHEEVPPTPPVNIQGKDIEIVDSDKYRGVHLKIKLDCTTNTEVLFKKGQSQLHLL